MLTTRRLVFGAALLFVLWQMLRPVSGVSTSNDKIDHVLVFAALAGIGLWARVGALGLLAGLAGFAVLTEVLQASVTSTRRGDPFDALADLVGALIVVGVWVAIGRLRPRLKVD